MSSVAAPSGAGLDAPAIPARLIDRIGLRLLWLVGFSGAFVMIEPAPYEVVILVAMIFFAAAGLTLRPTHLPLVFLLVLLNIGFSIGVVPVVALPGTAEWVAVSWFLAFTAIFFALALTEDGARRFDALLAGYLLGAVIASVIGILAYFRLLPSSESFLIALRIKSTFKDPNVFAPFLILPAVVVLGRMIFSRGVRRMVAAATIFIIASALLLSFSRGGWMHFAVSAAVFLGLSYLTRTAAMDRLRVVVFSVLILCAIGLLILALISLPQVQDLFNERARLIQYYDAGPTGRFGRHLLGAVLLLDHPFGIGPLQFARYFPEDPHNSLLASFAAGGWLSGAAYMTLNAVTLVLGYRCVFCRTELQPRLIAAYATFVGAVVESYIIDVLHWRHFYLLIGLIWAFSIASLARRPHPSALRERIAL